MAGEKKVDIINGAYSEMRISGITKTPTPEELALALTKLEDMAAEYEGRNICVGYNLQDSPDPNENHNIPRQFHYAFKTNLALRLLADFGKEPHKGLVAGASQSFSFLTGQTAPVRQTQYPSRMPIGSGSTLRYFRYQRFNRPQVEAPIGCATKKMFIDDIENFTEHYDNWLADTEAIASYTIEADDGLVITADANETPDITYTIRADGNNNERSNAFQQVKIVVTSDAGRILTRFIDFELQDSDL